MDYRHGKTYRGNRKFGRRDGIFEEDAFIPLPGFNGIVKRKVKQRKGKKELNRYRFHNDVERPSFSLIYGLLPDVFDIETGQGLESNKFRWFELILGRSPSKEDVPRITLPYFYSFTTLKATTSQPLIVGLGEPSPYETGITFDFLIGFPIIPGSAVKGVTRRAAIMILGAEHWDELSSSFEKKFKYQPQILETEIKDNNGNKLNYLDLLPYGGEFAFIADRIEKVVVPANFHKIFGTQDKKGEVIFMGAYPIDWSTAPDGKLFRIDIMNPHYGPYYETKGKEPPADWYNPVPIPYLTVNTGVRYRFVIASKDKNLLSKAVEWLAFALTNIGVGAKGSQGYGVFELETYNKKEHLNGED
ncbi:MAG: type III-B CRISPR module RAMP protein Cmr6 [Candidatus Hydrothermae bacterium]|nr:type III-B CRISPR module RAMP protein Cmr6 [Candidatus Hydrothermae bacterium]